MSVLRACGVLTYSQKRFFEIVFPFSQPPPAQFRHLVGLKFTLYQFLNDPRPACTEGVRPTVERPYVARSPLYAGIRASGRKTYCFFSPSVLPFKGRNDKMRLRTTISVE